MPDSDLEIRLAVYRYFAENAESPALEEMCDLLGQSSEEIQRAYQRLRARRLLVPSSDGNFERDRDDVQRLARAGHLKPEILRKRY